MQGKLRTIPMIRLSEEFKMLPSFSFTMNPAGYTVDLNLSVVSDKKIHKIRLSIGESFFDNLITQINFVSQRLFDLKNKFLGLEIGLWYQPRICIVKDEKDKNNQDIKIAVIDESNYLGGVCFINFMINIANRLNLELKAGYKTNGFMLEYTPLASAIFSARINYCFS